MSDKLDLENISDNAERLANMALALEGAMFEGKTSASSYGGAMSLFVSLMVNHAEEIKAFYQSVAQDAQKGGAE